MTFALNALIFVVNLVTGGDYGFLTKPPLVGDHGLVANYLIVSLALSAAIALTKKILELFLEQEAEKNDCKESLEMSFLFCTIDRLLTKFTVDEFLNRKLKNWLVNLGKN